MSIIATIIQDEYGDEELLIIKNKETGDVLIKQYFDSCEPYITPRKFLKHLDVLGVKYELKVEKDNR